MSVEASQLTLTSIPEWLHAASLSRLNGRLTGGKELSWRFLAHLAVDESGLPAAHRGLLRVLLGTEPGSSWSLTVMGRRAGLHRATASYVVADLEEWGWLHATRRSGHKTAYTVLVPELTPIDRVASPGRSRPIARGDGYPSQEATPLSQEATPPIARGDGTHRKRRHQGLKDPPSTQGLIKVPTVPASTSRSTPPDPRWNTVLRKLERRITTQTLPPLAPQQKRAVADLITEWHPQAWGDDDPAEDVLNYMVDEHPLDYENAMRACRDALGLTPADAAGIIADRARRRQERIA